MNQTGRIILKNNSFIVLHNTLSTLIVLIVELGTVYTVKIFGPGVDSGINRNGYQKYFLWLKAAGA
jgi:hypothetical protein